MTTPSPGNGLNFTYSKDRKHALRPALSRPAPCAGFPGCRRRRRCLSTRGRIHRVFRSSFAGPQFWHGGVMLQWPELWLCRKVSLYDRVGRADGPDLSAV